MMMIGLAVVVASSSLYGFGRCGGGPDRFSNRYKRGGLINSNNQSNSMYSFMSAISNLDLSNTQRADIREVMFKFKQNRIEQAENTNTPTIRFDEDGNFKKELFIQNRTNISQKMIANQANMIKEILNILNDNQKDTISKKLSLED